MINRRANRLALPFAAQQGDLRVSPVGISQNNQEEHPYTLPSRQRDSLSQTKRLRHAACGVVPKASRSREFESLSFQLCRETDERDLSADKSLERSPRSNFRLKFNGTLRICSAYRSLRRRKEARVALLQIRERSEPTDKQ